MVDFVTDYNFYSYLTASIAYLGLCFLYLLTAKKKSLAFELLLVFFSSFIWAGYIAYILYKNNLYFVADALYLETIRDIAIIFLLLSLLNDQQKLNYLFILKSKFFALISAFVLLTLFAEIYDSVLFSIQQLIGQDPRLFAHVIFSITGLILVEQLYRNTEPERRWNIKFLCIGLGTLFTLDFIIYSKSLLFQSMDDMLWNIRGFINAIITPLLFISINRLQNTTAPIIKASRKLVFHSVILFGTGFYLILMSIAGFYIRDYGGNWGNIAQTIFIFLAILVLIIAFVSGKIRAVTKFYFAKHFFRYRYDYRDEWIKLSKAIAQLESINALSSFIIKTMSELVDSSGGGLWLLSDQGDYYLAEQMSLGFIAPSLIKIDDSLLVFLQNKQWVIDFIEYAENPEIYEEVDLSFWSDDAKNVWLIVPLFQQNKLQGVVVLVKAKVPRKLNWEDHDLLKTVGLQLANALALSHASEALAKAKQFEAYNRLSAFLVHDLKNLVAQIALIVKNSDKHKYNPEFIDDSIATLHNVIHKIDHILGQLKKGQLKENDKQLIDLVELMDDVAIQQSCNKPLLQITIKPKTKIEILGDKEKITAILGHLVQNAQEATPDDGYVNLELSQDDEYAIIKIQDNGCGMDDKFMAERLFKPFDTTKGNAGMGIGVYEARDYIINHAGQIVVESAVGIGSLFYIKLPLFSQSDEHR